MSNKLVWVTQNGVQNKQQKKHSVSSHKTDETIYMLLTINKNIGLMSYEDTEFQTLVGEWYKDHVKIFLLFLKPSKHR